MKIHALMMQCTKHKKVCSETVLLRQHDDGENDERCFGYGCAILIKIFACIEI